MNRRRPLSPLALLAYAVLALLVLGALVWEGLGWLVGRWPWG